MKKIIHLFFLISFYSFAPEFSPELHEYSAYEKDFEDAGLLDKSTDQSDSGDRGSSDQSQDSSESIDDRAKNTEDTLNQVESELDGIKDSPELGQNQDAVKTEEERRAEAQELRLETQDWKQALSGDSVTIEMNSEQADLDASQAPDFTDEQLRLLDTDDLQSLQNDGIEAETVSIEPKDSLEEVKAGLDEYLKVLDGTSDLTTAQKNNLKSVLGSKRDLIQSQFDKIQEIFQAKFGTKKDWQDFVSKVGKVSGRSQRAKLVKELNTLYKTLKMFDALGDNAKSAFDIEYVRNLAISKESNKIDFFNDNQSAVVDFVNTKINDLHSQQKSFLEKSKNAINSLGDVEFVKYLASLDSGSFSGDVVKALQDVHDGDDILTQVLNGDLTSSSGTTKERNEQIRKIQWALYSKAVGQEPRGFTGGMLRIPERENPERLYDFINSTGNYSRLSTHYKGLRENALGLDFGDKGALPNQKAHLHYGKLKDGSMYVKWEGYGTKSPKDAFNHLKQLLKKKSGAIAAQEKVPVQIKVAFDSIVEDYNNNPKNKIKLNKKDVKSEGISAMSEALKNFPDAQSDFNDVLKLWDYVDTADERKGNEVVRTYLNNNALK